MRAKTVDGRHAGRYFYVEQQAEPVRAARVQVGVPPVPGRAVGTTARRVARARGGMGA